MLNTDKQKLMGAPQFNQQAESSLGNVDFASNVYRHFGESPWWEGAGQATGQGFGNVHKVSDLMGTAVKDSSNQDFGKVDNVIVDLTDGRIPFVVLTPTGTFGLGQRLYAIPPNAFTHGADQKTLVTGLDREKLQAAPQVTKNNLKQLSDPAFAASIYEYYGKQPYWNAVSPTGR